MESDIKPQHSFALDLRLNPIYTLTYVLLDRAKPVYGVTQPKTPEKSRRIKKNCEHNGQVQEL